MDKPSTKRKTRTQARQEFLDQAGVCWDEFDGWYQAHPEATYQELEAALRPLRRQLMGQAVALVLSQGDLGASPAPPVCAACGQPMEFKGYPGKTVHGLEGESRLHRAYYYCSACEAGLFPPGPAVAGAAGPVECGGSTGDGPPGGDAALV